MSCLSQRNREIDEIAFAAAKALAKHELRDFQGRISTQKPRLHHRIGRRCERAYTTSMPALSVIVTTYNNADTLAACLASVAWADERLVLDSFSTDDTVDIARRYGCRVHQHRFLGYGRQKQLASELAHHDWVLLLDADEMVSQSLAQEVQTLLRTEPEAAGYTMARCEQVFWKMSASGVRWNHYLRLWDRREGRLGSMPIHAAPQVDGAVGRLYAPFFHFGENDIHVKVDKVNAYSTGLVRDKLDKGVRANPLIMIVYPPWYFFRSFVLKRGFMDGWAGFIASVVMAFYAFMKYAKLYEYAQFERHGDSLLPDNAPQGRKRSGTAEDAADADIPVTDVNSVENSP